MYIIEKNVPVPADVKREQKYPFAAMEIGDSFVAPKHRLSTIRAAASYYSRRYKKKFAVRTDPSSPDSIRIWRTL